MSSPGQSPEALFREAAISLLSATFNTTYAANATAFYPAAPPTMVINWTTPPNTNSSNFFRGRLKVEDIIGTGVFTFPLVTAYAIGALNKNLQKFQEFAGFVNCGFDFHLSGNQYQIDRLLSDYESWPDCVTKTFLDAVVTPNVYAGWSGNGLVYNGDVKIDRLPVRRTAENWLQTVQFVLTGEVVIRP
jgi:hypothetical protein